jgi:hypothetical protein
LLVSHDAALAVFLVLFATASMAWLTYCLVRLSRRDKLDGSMGSLEWIGWRFQFAGGFLLITVVCVGIGWLLGLFS